jgi:4-carboxymuconolactone decarboxylase
MRVVHIDTHGRKRDDYAIFRGEVETQAVVGADVSRELRLTEVHFKHGAVNRWHMHSCDQILIVTEGEGIVADETEERPIATGDVAFIPANTKHWHGAKPGKDMTHLAILANGKTTIAE